MQGEAKRIARSNRRIPFDDLMARAQKSGCLRSLYFGRDWCVNKPCDTAELGG